MADHPDLDVALRMPRGEVTRRKGRIRYVDRETFATWIAEGQELRRAFDEQTAPMRHITGEDLGRRSR